MVKIIEDYDKLTNKLSETEEAVDIYLAICLEKYSIEKALFYSLGEKDFRKLKNIIEERIFRINKEFDSSPNIQAGLKKILDDPDLD